MIIFFWFLYKCFLTEIPAGISGQPRSGTLPEGWFPHYSLISFYIGCFISLVFVYRYPFIGIIVYLFLSHLFPVHQPPWIYTQWIGIRTIVALFTLAASLISKDLSVLSVLFKKDFSFKVFTCFIIWYLISFLYTSITTSDYSAPLQFHPVLFLEAFALYLVVILEKDPKKIIFLIAVSMAIILSIRIIFIQSYFHKVADLAKCIVITLPLLMFTAVNNKNKLLRLCFLVLCAGGIWLIYIIQNRGAAVGLVLLVVAFWITSRHRLYGLIAGIPIVCIALIWFMGTSFGKHFLSAFKNLDTIFNTNLRLLTWKGGIQMGLDNLVFGVGPGNFIHWIGNYEPLVALHSSHNMFVDTFAEGGLPGFIFYVLLQVSVCYKCFINSKTKTICYDRFILMSLFAHLGVGMFLTETRMILPYMLMGIIVHQSECKLPAALH